MAVTWHHKRGGGKLATKGLAVPSSYSGTPHQCRKWGWGRWLRSRREAEDKGRQNRWNNKYSYLNQII